jgi:acetyltransferase-like isoleucine patch superfamily enzyme
MVYAQRTNNKQLGLLSKIIVKSGVLLAKGSPHYKLRRWGLFLCGFEIGKKVYVGEDFLVVHLISERSCHLIIGDRVAIGPRVTAILSSDANWSRLMDQFEYIKSTIILEEDCWIGAGVILLPGVSIGKGAVVGAGSIVTKDVPPFTVVAGNPAKEVKKLNPF